MTKKEQPATSSPRTARSQPRIDAIMSCLVEQHAVFADRQRSVVFSQVLGFGLVDGKLCPLCLDPCDGSRLVIASELRFLDAEGETGSEVHFLGLSSFVSPMQPSDVVTSSPHIQRALHALHHKNTPATPRAESYSFVSLAAAPR